MHKQERAKSTPVHRLLICRLPIVIFLRHFRTAFWQSLV